MTKSVAIKMHWEILFVSKDFILGFLCSQPTGYSKEQDLLERLTGSQEVSWASLRQGAGRSGILSRDTLLVRPLERKAWARHLLQACLNLGPDSVSIDTQSL